MLEEFKEFGASIRMDVNLQECHFEEPTSREELVERCQTVKDKLWFDDDSYEKFEEPSLEFVHQEKMEPQDEVQELFENIFTQSLAKLDFPLINTNVTFLD